MIKRFGVLIALLWSVTAWAATPTVRFDPKTVNVGRVSATGGVVSRKFVCFNDSDRPMVVLKATTTCSCTKVSFSKKPIRPGQSSALTVTYDPRHQSGDFLKTVQVCTNQSAQPFIIVLKGTVTE